MGSGHVLVSSSTLHAHKEEALMLCSQHVEHPSMRQGLQQDGALPSGSCFGPSTKGVTQPPSCSALSIYSVTQEKLTEQMGSSAGAVGKEECSFMNYYFIR